MKVEKLDSTTFDIIVECFIKSFENYFVKVSTDKDYYKDRWETAKVDFSLSYGMFDDDQLVGFIINAIDDRYGERIAFNTGTGVLPAYRGRRIVKSIYDVAIPDLKLNGISKCSLEVIIENSKAIKSYQSIGFKTCKTFYCFSGEIEKSSNEDFELKEVTYASFDWENLPNQHLYSWDFNSRVIKNGAYGYYQVIKDGLIESYFAFNPKNGYVAQFEVLKDDDASWNRLFLGIEKMSKVVKLINVEASLKRKLAFIKSAGLTNTVNQYEMEMNI